MKNKVELKLDNNLNELSRFLMAVESSSWFLELETKQGYVVNLALEEMISNIVKYGYDDTERHVISVSVEPHLGGIKLTIRDDGHEFNPLCANATDITSELYCRPIGGVGILLTKNLSREIKYDRVEEKNVLTIII